MPQITPDIEEENRASPRARVLFFQFQDLAHRRTDRLFAWLMAIQWVAGIVFALVVSPRAWDGAESQIHGHVWIAVFLGALVSGFPIMMVLRYPGAAATRHAVAVGQMLTSALLIHLMGGRIEAHFHIFGSLAFLAFYRDWKVIVTATLVVVADHILRGVFWPESIFGILASSHWRWLEHAVWVLFEDAFLLVSIHHSVREMLSISVQRAELERINVEVEKKVEDRTSELNEKNAALEHAVRAKSNFVASMSHELRTPLNGIIGFSELMSDGLAGEVNVQQKEYLGDILSGSHHLLQLINDVLDLAKFDADKMELHAQTFSLAESVDQACALVKPLVRSKQILLTKAVSPELTWAVLDPKRFKQILFNLLSNAIKFTPELGSVEIRVIPEGSDHFSICVRDTGIGIKAADIPRLFKEFEQLDQGSARHYQGTGLGLVLTRKIVEIQGGSIRVESELGKGSAFTVTLPLSLGEVVI